MLQAFTRCVERRSCGRSIQEDVGRTEVPRTVVGELGGTPLAGRRERDRVGQYPPGARGVLGDDGGEARVRMIVRGADGGEYGHGIDRFRSRAEMFDRRERERTLGEGAGLVEADGVHSGEALDRREFLGEDLLARQSGGAQREGDAREQHESFRDHGNETGHRTLNRLDETFMTRELRRDQDDGDRDHHPADDGDDPVDPCSQFALHQ